MAYKVLVMDNFECEDYKNLTLLCGSRKDVVITAEFRSHSKTDDFKENDVIELAVNLKEMKRMRSFLDHIINQVERDYEGINEEIE